MIGVNYNIQFSKALFRIFARIIYNSIDIFYKYLSIYINIFNQQFLIYYLITCNSLIYYYYFLLQKYSFPIKSHFKATFLNVKKICTPFKTASKILPSTFDLIIKKKKILAFHNSSKIILLK